MIQLTSQEEKIFQILIQTVQQECPSVILRVAGGWVRDRVLGLDSDDIDIAVEGMSGISFAKRCHALMQKLGYAEHSPTKIAANTEANKNLESAILRIHGVEVDFTQLRREFYTEESRNPHIQTEGVTPAEDARRRDLTINALFFNIHNREIEDYVGGLNDLKRSVARTPIDPLCTFLDDPLRILRCIRFAAKYELFIAPEIELAAQHNKVRQALTQKVSRERVWTEFSKFMAGPNFWRAAKLIEDIGLRDFLLQPEDERHLTIEGSNTNKWEKGFGNWDMDQNNPNHTYSVWIHSLTALKWLHDNIDSKLSFDDRLVRNIAMLLHDVGKCDICSQQIHPEGRWSTYHDHETSSAIAADVILRQLKAPNEVRERVVNLVQNHMRLHLLPKKSKTGLRRVLRKVGAQNWHLLIEISKADSMGKTGKTLDEKYDQFNDYILSFIESLGGRSEVKPPINGHQVMETLGLLPGRQIGIIMDALKEKLIEQPDMDETQAIEFIKGVQL